MSDLTTLPHQLDAKKGTCRAIIETPKGCRNKFDYDPDSNLFMLGGLLPEGMMFPFDFGFIPSTLGDDGDPLDILVLMDAPAHVGCLIEVRLVGVKTLLSQLEELFVSYSRQRGKKFRITGIAMSIITATAVLPGLTTTIPFSYVSNGPVRRQRTPRPGELSLYDPGHRRWSSQEKSRCLLALSSLT